MPILDSIKRSATVSLNDLINELKSKGVKVLSLAVGEPHFNTEREIIEEAYRAMINGETHYVSSQGIIQLREAIAKKASLENLIPASASNVVIVPAKFAIYASLIALLDEGDEVLLPNPCWVSYESQIILARGKPVYYDLNDDFSLNFDEISFKLSDKTKAIIINSPHNPTGYVLTKEEMEHVVELAKDYNLYIISDEIYEKYIYEGKHISPASLDFDRTITINGFSKAFAMTGWRLGYLIANKDIINKIVTFVEQTLTCIPPFIQKAGVKSLELGEKIYKRYVEEYKKARDYVYERLSKINNIAVNKPGGAFYMFPRYLINVDSYTLAQELLLKKGVAIVPGSSFGSRGEFHFRISYATSFEILKEAMDRIENYFDGYR